MTMILHYIHIIIPSTALSTPRIVAPTGNTPGCTWRCCKQLQSSLSPLRITNLSSLFAAGMHIYTYLHILRMAPVNFQRAHCWPICGLTCPWASNGNRASTLCGIRDPSWPAASHLSHPRSGLFSPFNGGTCCLYEGNNPS